MNNKNDDFPIIIIKKLKAEFSKSRNDHFVESTISSRRCVSEHKLTFFDNVRSKFEKIIFANKCFKRGFAMKVWNNVFNYIRCELLSKYERKYNSCRN